MRGAGASPHRSPARDAQPPGSLPNPLKGVTLPPCTMLGPTADHLARPTHRRVCVALSLSQAEAWKAEIFSYSSRNHLRCWALSRV